MIFFFFFCGHHSWQGSQLWVSDLWIGISKYKQTSQAENVNYLGGTSCKWCKIRTFCFHTPQMCVKDTCRFVHSCLLIEAEGRRKKQGKGVLSGLWGVWKWGPGTFWKSLGLWGGLKPACFSPGSISCLSPFWTWVRWAGIEVGPPDPFATWLPIYLEPLPAPWGDSELCHSWALSVSRAVVGSGPSYSLGQTLDSNSINIPLV